ncbi:MAG: EscU/YscU/HrcU family type III secretion system export apparatus switch protein [Kiritimatiellae bacterium]|nr:EscU/YscU/HrcU family type III secretion system export apparatus switch protein [Kiritimatiellia bacterium]
MAESAGEKTEMPTPKKLRDARNKGQVCSSKDIISTALLILGFCLCAAVVGIFANTAQIGFLFTFEPLKPDMNKLNIVEGFKRIFAKRNLFEFLKNVVKIVFLGYLVWKIIWAAVPELLTMCYGTIDDIFPCVALMLKRLACYTAFGYIVIAVVDRLFQGRDYTKQMMMTKDEVKREYKEMEGSSEVKQAQRQFRDEILNGPEPAKATREADVVVTNPTHLAIGIRYRSEEAPLPKIVVAGADRIAKIIRETALEEGIPIMEDVTLARRLYALGKVEDYIPPELVEPVAEVLKWVKRLEQARREERELDEIAL